MLQFFLNQLKKRCKQNISLLLVLVMIFSMAPQSYATEAQGTVLEDTTTVTEPETTEAAVAETTEATVPETMEATVPETTEATVPETTEAAVPETTEETIAEEIIEETFSQQLQTLETLKEVFDAMMANPEAVYALTVEEIAELKVYTQSLYDGIAEPTQDDTEYLELILDTLTMLEEELTIPVELLDETVTIVRNGSRFF